ncbi:LLM class flavin-dependent oxidoreductase [Cytobacillus suaedae]|nr:LLM class flavin-dependent oxidoreductase [Cytobacillus suaedae]
MRLSILDQAPISSLQTPKDALQESMKLAQVGEKYGYTRYWIAEHHDLSGLACSAPEVMLSYIGANTTTIRIGCGAVLLPHYKPYKVAEVYNMLATLFPNRIDVGIGRAPGGSAEATNALSENFLQQVWRMPTSVKELLHFLENDFPEDHPYAKVKAEPIPEISPTPWLLGTSKKSAILAGENGMSYNFGLFMSDNDGVQIIQQYKDAFVPRQERHKPNTALTVSIICAETTEKAKEIALSTQIWSIQKSRGEGNEGVPSIEDAKKYSLTDQETQALEKMNKKMLIGNPKEVSEKLHELHGNYKVDEIMIVTITHSPQDRSNSYKLIATELLGYSG